jgi:hypothetical protein
MHMGTHDAHVQTHTHRPVHTRAHTHTHRAGAHARTQAEAQPGPAENPVGELALSGAVAARLSVLDVSDCTGLRSIECVRACTRLARVWMPGCASVTDLSPLVACSETLEELWLAGNEQLSHASLAPLAACPRLRKLDLRDCGTVLERQVADMRRGHAQPADPVSVRLEGLVHDLCPTMSVAAQTAAVWCLGDECDGFVSPASLAEGGGGAVSRTAAAAAGAIPALVRLLVPDHSAGAQVPAARALKTLTADHADNMAAVAAAGAVPLMLLLLGVASPAARAGAPYRAPDPYTH